MVDELIVSDAEILGGKPCVRGIRLSVEFLLELAASGATEADTLACSATSCWASRSSVDQNTATNLVSSAAIQKTARQNLEAP
jgi:hypothetical protein